MGTGHIWPISCNLCVLIALLETIQRKKGYDDLLTTGIKADDTNSEDGWYLYTTYQPEGKMVSWEESYGVVLEIATFARASEVQTDAHDLLQHSTGYSVYTRNLCLFFYDSSILDAHRAAYLAVLNRVCT